MRIVKIENNKIYSTSTLCEKTDILKSWKKFLSAFSYGISVKTWERMNIFRFAKTCTQNTKTITRSTRQHLKP